LAASVSPCSEIPEPILSLLEPELELVKRVATEYMEEKMKLNIFQIGAVLIALSLCVRGARAQDTAFTDLGLNVNGNYIDAYSDVNFLSDAASMGVDLNSFSTGATGDMDNTGLGTITYTTTSSGYFDIGIWDAVGNSTFWDEYATTGGTLASGESYDVANENFATLGSYDPNTTPAFTDVAGGGSLDDTNNVPGETSNILQSCVGADCDANTAAELGYAFTLGADDEEIITVTASETAPTSGFYIEELDPNDENANYCAAADSSCPALSPIYFSLSAEEMSTTPPPAGVPEGGSSLVYLLLAALTIGGALLFTRRQGAGSWLRNLPQFNGAGAFPVLFVLPALGLVMAPCANAQQVLTVQEVPTSPGSPHTAYAGANIVLGAVFTGAVANHNYTFSWNYGDGSTATTPVAITAGEGTPSFNDISSSHVYSGTTPGVTSWTAQVTVLDTTTSTPYTGNIIVLWENNTLASRVNVAIDWGLWYLHQIMSHPSATSESSSSAGSPGATGSWAAGCAPGYYGFSCGNGAGSLDATNVQAFEVNGHYSNGPATDPYTADVAEGTADMLGYLERQAVASNTYTYNPATANFGCSDGTAPTTTNSGSPHYYCDSSATPVYYEQPPIAPYTSAAASSCTGPPCTITFDGNSNGYAVYSNGNYGYENGMFIDSLVASSNPTGMGTLSWGTESYKDLVQDMVDMAGYCQYPNDNDVSIGDTRGSGNQQGGGWWYSYECQDGDDNSTSQWTSIGLIAAQRGFGIAIPQIIPDMNNMWVTASQNVEASDNWTSPNSGPPANMAQYGDDDSTLYGGFGYNGSLYYSNAWGPWAVTPSGMVQMSLDGIGRTTNTAFGDANNAADQRFNWAESLYADNFCNPVSTGSYDSGYYAPRLYTYGMFSFTKSMLLHNPGGTLTPITYLRTMTPGVFTSTNPNTPANTIDWYGAIGPEDGGTDSCDGIAQTLVDRQQFLGGDYGNGYWYYNYNTGASYDISGAQYSYETAWSIIMLQKSVFVACVNNLTGEGVAGGGLSKPKAGLTWTGIPTATGYNIQRSTTNDGPYTTVGSTAATTYTDTSGLVNGNTYYYVLQPTNAGGAVCQSNQAIVKIP